MPRRGQRAEGSARKGEERHAWKPQFSDDPETTRVLSLCEEGREEEALAVIRDSAVPLHKDAFDVVINAMSVNGNVDGVREAYRMMLDQGNIRPNRFTLVSILFCFKRGGDLDGLRVRYCVCVCVCVCVCLAARRGMDDTSGSLFFYIFSFRRFPLWLAFRPWKRICLNTCGRVSPPNFSPT